MILAFILDDVVVKNHYLDYIDSYRQINKQNFSYQEKLDLFSTIERKKCIIQKILATKNQYVHGKWSEHELASIQSPIIKAKITNHLFLPNEFKDFLYESQTDIPDVLFHFYETLLNTLNPNQFILFWNIEETEWNALL